MNISGIQANQGKLSVEGKIVEKDNPRSFDKFGKKGKVCNAVLKDDSGEIKLTLWNEEVDKVEVGDKVRIINGFCGE
ncbi:MAG: SOSS complex subunit B family protein, partial [Nanoarchaeota archaeon]